MIKKTRKTEEAIKTAASRLFALWGYDATSIRDIAQEADVNVASVNYYFNNKETLYWKTFLAALQSLKEELEKIDTNKDIPSLAWDVFQVLLKNHQFVVHVFKMMFSGPKQRPEHDVVNFLDQLDIDPPGAELFKNALKREAPNASDEHIQWGAFVILCQVVHIATVFKSPYVQWIRSVQGQESEAKLEQDIKRLAEAVLTQVRRSGES